MKIDWRNRIGTLCLMLISLAALPVFGASLTVNGGFESPLAPAGCFTFNNPPFPLCGSVPGWTGSFAIDSDTSGGTIGGPPQTPIPEGIQWAMVFNSDGFSQTVNVTQAGSYTLTWSDAGRGLNPFGNSGNQSYNVAVGGNVLGFFTTTTGSPWVNRSITFSAGPGNLALDFNLTGGGGAAAYFDNVQLNLNVPATTPEPSTLGLVIAALGVLGFRRRG